MQRRGDVRVSRRPRASKVVVFIGVCMCVYVWWLPAVTPAPPFPRPLNLHFDVCGGFTNQRLSVMYAMVLGYILGATSVVLPTLQSSYEPGRGQPLAFSDVYDVDRLRAALEPRYTSFPRLVARETSSSGGGGGGTLVSVSAHELATASGLHVARRQASPSDPEASLRYTHPHIHAKMTTTLTLILVLALALAAGTCTRSGVRCTPAYSSA
jgi:hypothetical protein